jgi:hypothetical protein
MPNTQIVLAQPRRSRSASSGVEVMIPRAVRRGSRGGSSQGQITQSQALSNRKGKSSVRRAPISESENDYLNTLIDPSGCQGKKIPDFVSIPSSTFVTENYGIVTSNAAGDQAMVFIPRLAGQTYLQTSATTTWTWAAAANNPQLATLTGLFEQIRPVSMKVKWDYIGSTANDQGSIACSIQARQGTAAAEAAGFPTTFATLLSAENSFVGSARNGIEMIWVPQDQLDLDYSSPIAAGFSGSGAFNDRLNNVMYPFLVFACSGCVASTPSFRYTITINWEALPNQSTVGFVHTSPSPTSIMKLQGAFNWVKANMPKLARFVSRALPYVETGINGLLASGMLGPGAQTIGFGRLAQKLLE